MLAHTEHFPGPISSDYITSVMDNSLAQESKPIRRHLKGRLLGLVRIGNQSADDIDEKVGRAAMASMFNLSQVF